MPTPSISCFDLCPGPSQPPQQEGSTLFSQLSLERPPVTATALPSPSQRGSSSHLGVLNSTHHVFFLETQYEVLPPGDGFPELSGQPQAASGNG